MVICIVVGVIALVIGFFFGKFGGKEIDPCELAEKINFAVGTENDSLKKENETLKKKNLFFSDWFIRSYIEQYYRRKMTLQDYQIYTSDALESLKLYAKMALDNFEGTWNSKPCNEQCEWVKEYLEELISKIDVILNDKWGDDILDSENEDAFRRFFVGIETNMFFDRNAKEAGRETTKLVYWKPQIEHDDF
jgi:hypothetical protein